MKKLALVSAIITIISANTFAVVSPADKNTEDHKVTISVPKVALLDLEGTKDITLKIDGPKEAGEAVSFENASNSGIWVNYSSIAEKNKTRKVTVELDKNVPDGIYLKVLASSYTGSGKGAHGSASGKLTLTTTAQDIVTEVGSCYTGNGEDNGHNLTYSLELTSDADYAKLLEGDTEITVTYTLVDEN